MLDLWIVFAFISGVFVSLREMYIKRYVKESSEVISFTTRFYGSIVLIFIALKGNISINNIPVFIGVTLLTVLITAFTTMVRLTLIKTEELSLTTPWLGTVPIFVVLWSAVLYREVPGLLAIVGILLVCIGAFTINLKDKAIKITKASLWMLLIAFLLGLTTSVDKMAIGASTAITYTLLWTIASAVLMYGVSKKRNGRAIVVNKHLFVQAIFWVVEFLFQMLAVQQLNTTGNGPTYVKTLTMLNIVITTVVSSLVFREKDRGKRIISALFIFAGAVLVVLFR